ncbi:MAG: hypothetical protein ABI352_00710 [Candidatus Dormibacter sp.]
MLARTSTWTGTPEALDKWAAASANVRSFVEALAGNAGAYFLVDHAQGRALTLTLWATEEAAVASDVAADESRARTVAATGMELLERCRYEVIDNPQTS